jgi:hypothetical protein
MNRRFLGFTALTAVIAKWIPNMEAKKVEKLFAHQVYFWLNNPTSEADKKMLIKGLKTLLKIKKIKAHHIGIPAGTHREVVDSSYSVSWLIFFNSAKDQDVYQSDALHEKFVNEYKHLWSKVVVYDSVGL